MKKLILASIIILITIAFSACTKENVQPQKHTVSTLADKGNLSQADLIGDPATPSTSDKGNLSQADGEAGH